MMAINRLVKKVDTITNQASVVYFGAAFAKKVIEHMEIRNARLPLMLVP